MAVLEDTIRKAIETSGQSRYRIAKETGVSQAHLSRLMSGQRGMSVEMLERLAPYLGLEIVIRPAKRRGRESKRR